MCYSDLVEAIAVIYGMQGSLQGGGRPELSVMIKNIAEGIKILYSEICNINISNNLNSQFMVNPDESIPLALVMNEIITNAIKHSVSEALCEVDIDINYDADDVIIKVSNNGHLPDDFNLSNEKDTGTGLKLVRSLMPFNERQFRLYENNEKVFAQIKLDSNMIYQLKYAIKSREM